MPSLAKSPLAPVLGQRVPLRGPARLLHRSYAKTRYEPSASVVRVTSATGDVFDADLSSNLEWQLWTFGSWEQHFGELFEYAPELLDDPVAQAPFDWLADRGYLLYRIRAARHGITGRTRLALDRMPRLPRVGGNLLAIAPRVAPLLSGLLG